MATIFFRDPVHAVDRGLMMKFVGGARRDAISVFVERKYGAAGLRVTGIPFSAQHDLGFTIPRDILGTEADMILLGQLSGEFVHFPIGSTVGDGALRIC